MLGSYFFLSRPQLKPQFLMKGHMAALGKLWGEK
jgi:hypothetical protein